MRNRTLSHGADARFGQCTDLATVRSDNPAGLPRVHRCVFDHFRLANHDLPHGFIGGNDADHWINRVDRYSAFTRVSQ